MTPPSPGTAWSEPPLHTIEARKNAILIVDGAGTIVLANRAAEELLGFDADTLSGRPVGVLECERFEPAALAGLCGAPEPDDARCATARRADGSAIDLAIRSHVVNAQHDRLVLFSVADLNERSSAFAMDEPDRPHAAQTDGWVDPADWCQTPGRWHLEVPSRELIWSDELYPIMGRPTTYRPTVEDVIAAWHPADRERVVALVERAMRDGNPFRDEARLIRPDGSMRVVVHGAEARRSAGGEIVSVVGFCHDVTEQNNAQRERERLNESAMLANRAGQIGMWDLDLRTNVSTWNGNMYALYGIDDTTMIPTFERWRGLIHPHDRERAVQEVTSDIAGGEPSDTQFRIIWANGEIHYVRSLVSIVCDAAGVPARLIGTDWDVTEIRLLADQLRAEKEALVRSEERYRALTEAMPQMVWLLDAQETLEYVNRRWLSYTGLALDASRPALVALIDASDAIGMNAMRRREPPQEFECEARLRRADGVYRWHLVRGVPFADASGEAGKWIVTATDIEERKTAERTLAATVAELEHLAHHDPMTDLPNRMLLMDRLSQAITHANRVHGGVIVLYVDLDRFKSVNDSLGHGAGDLVLKQTGVRILETLRAGDTASRVGGDEFIVVCATSGRGDDVARIATRILAAVTKPMEIGGEEIIVEASIGVTVYPFDGFDADTLIRKADAAMYSAKQNGRNTFRRYSNEAHMSVVAAAEFEAELRHGIAAGQLVVYYQPIIDLRTSRPRAAEALVRWQHPRRGLLPPAEFIAFAEERGIVAQIGDVVLETACAMLKRLRLAGRSDIRIGVNVSANQFGKPDFVEGIVAKLERHGIDPNRLAIEITESVVMGNTRATLATLDELQALGVSLSIDDFGTGYSSLAYIKRFPISTLKIDRSFVNDIADDTTDQAIAKTIITLAHSLGMRVCAEGVETEAQLSTLRSFDVDSVQGFLFSRPVPVEDFERYVERFAEPIASANALPDVAPQPHNGRP